jgi:hypothetical protein
MPVYPEPSEKLGIRVTAERACEVIPYDLRHADDIMHIESLYR